MDASEIYHGYYVSLSKKAGNSAKVDREGGRLLGYVVAQEGNFKTPNRGRFDESSLQAIIQIGNSKLKGLKSRFSHPTESNDGLGKHLGRSTNFRMTQLTDGKLAVRADLKFDPSAYKTPSGDLATYVMDLAESDSDALSSSLVLRTKKVYDLDDSGKKKDDSPPLWIPTELHASDIVDTGDAVDGLLSTDELPNGYLWKASLLLDTLFKELSREEITLRVNGFLEKYLTERFGEQPGLSVPKQEYYDSLRGKLKCY